MKTNKIQIHKHTKHSELFGHCCICLEKSKFRHCLLNGVNSIVCIFCMTGKPLLKGCHYPDYMILKKLTFIHWLQRFFIRGMNPKRTFKIFKARGFSTKQIWRYL